MAWTGSPSMASATPNAVGMSFAKSSGPSGSPRLSFTAIAVSTLNWVVPPTVSGAMLPFSLVIVSSNSL